MKFLILTAWDSRAVALGEAATPNRAGYAARHGYGHVSVRWPVDEGCWLKPNAIGQWLPACDWLLWLDADARITNPDATLEGIVSAHADDGTDVLVSCDANGLNAGVLMWRNSEWGRRFVRDWYGAKGYCDNWPCGEQTALASRLWREPGRVRVVPQRTFNSYRYGEYRMEYPDGEWRPGDFVLHLPGMDNRRRLEIFRELSNG